MPEIIPAVITVGTIPAVITAEVVNASVDSGSVPVTIVRRS